LCLSKGEVTKRKGHPAAALARRPARQVREAGPGFSTGLLPRRKGIAILGLARCAALSSPPHRRRGAPGTAGAHRARQKPRQKPSAGSLPPPSHACRGGVGWGALAVAVVSA